MERKTLLIVFVIATAVMIPVIALIGYVIVSENSGVTASMDDNGLHVKAPMTNVYIDYGDIVSIELRDEFTRGYASNGYKGMNFEVAAGKTMNWAFILWHITIMYSSAS